MRLPNPDFQASNDDNFVVERLQYQSHLISKDLYTTVGRGPIFGDVCDKLLIKEVVRVKRREFAPRSLVMLRSRMSRHVLPFFGSRLVAQITSSDLEEFLTYLYEFELSDITINQYFNALRKVLTHAFELELIDKLPRFPKLKMNSIPRGGFTVTEYKKLLRYAKTHRSSDDDNHVKTHRDTKDGIYSHKEELPFEFAWLIGFMVNSFIRPVDVKLIQHQHVEIVRGKYIYLRLTLPETKKHRTQIVTLFPAVRIYEKLVAYMAKKDLAKPTDYLFLPEILDREAASYLITRDFRKVLIGTHLRKGHLDQNKTLYSLRHTAITFRLLYGKGIDLLTLARNARTSVEMIERFYASQLTPEMNIALLQSRR
jgi:site-specific recombinase XerD